MTPSMAAALGSLVMVGFLYSSYYSALVANASSPEDATALAHLPAGPNNPVTGSANINLKSANGRALGFNTPGFVNGTFDGVIGLNTHITDISSLGTTVQYSLLATTEHEIDEVWVSARIWATRILSSTIPQWKISLRLQREPQLYDQLGCQGIFLNRRHY